MAHRPLGVSPRSPFETLLAPLFGVIAAFVAAVPAQAATISFSVGQSYTVGQTIPVKVVVSAENGESLNAISAAVSYPTSQLRLVSISKAGSIVNMWATEPAADDGAADLEGIVLNPGFSGASGLVATLSFKAVGPGSATLSFGQASVLANDGQGTNVLTAAPSRSLYIGAAGEDAADSTSEPATPPGSPSAPAITSPTNPDPARWYSNPNPSFSWVVPPGTTAVRLQYDSSPLSVPGVSYSPAISSKTLSKVPDGVYYFHAQFKNDKGWGAVSHFKFSIDTVPPRPFQVTLAHPENDADSRPIIYFNTTDSGSGMDRYDVKVGDSEYRTLSAETVGSNPYAPPELGLGQKTVVVNAYDKAGNKTTASADITVEALDAPAVTDYPSEIEEGDLLIMSGKSYPAATVALNIKDERGVVYSQTTNTGAVSGGWSIVWSKRLSAGVYIFTVSVKDGKGGESYQSAPLSFAVRQRALYRIGSMVINYLSLGLAAIVAAAVLVAGIMFAVHRLNILRRKMRRSISEAERSIHAEFDEVVEDMAGHLAILENAKTKRELTREEETIFTSMRKRLGSMERGLVSRLEKLKKEVD